jgi:hypothetical protein
MHPVRAFFASLSMSLLALTLSYQAAAIPAALSKPELVVGPKSDAWMEHTSVKKVKKGEDKDDMSELVPLLSAS